MRVGGIVLVGLLVSCSTSGPPPERGKGRANVAELEAARTLAELRTFDGIRLPSSGRLVRDARGWRLAPLDAAAFPPAATQAFAPAGADMLDARLPTHANAPLRVARAGRDDLWLEITADAAGDADGAVAGPAVVFRVGAQEESIHVAAPGRVEELRLLRAPDPASRRYRIREGAGHRRRRRARRPP
ncbi:MAG: hypothetical protein HYV09_12820 [Deltaproteobacteria bacterium]|nr:hypothetical protein [Deltaproteobacteria bacterium]